MRPPQLMDEQGRIETDVHNGKPHHYSDPGAMVDVSESRNPADKWRRESVRYFMNKSIPEPDRSVRYQKVTQLEDGRLWCASCQTHLEPTAFNKDKRNAVRGRRWYCRECEAEQRLKRYHAHKFDKVLSRSA